MTLTIRPGPRTPLSTELAAQAARLGVVPVPWLFERDPKRFERFSREQAGLLADLLRQRIDEIVLAKLCQLADATGLRERIEAMWRGERINASEDRAALHAFRAGAPRCEFVSNIDGPIRAPRCSSSPLRPSLPWRP
jgi:glucose-6-phosphate isomerase